MSSAHLSGFQANLHQGVPRRQSYWHLRCLFPAHKQTVLKSNQTVTADLVFQVVQEHLDPSLLCENPVFDLLIYHNSDVQTDTGIT